MATINKDSEFGLPSSIELAWGLRQPSGRGPRRVLSLPEIVDAAVRIAELEGLAAVSMSRIANDLSVSTMSLYRYVSAKDELLLLMVDAAFGPPAPLTAEPESDGWRAGLEQWSWRYLDMLRSHPWVVHIPISGPPSTPNQVAWAEQGLSCLRGSGLEAKQKMSTILLLSGLVRNEAALVDTYDMFDSSSAGEAMMSYRLLLEKLADPEEFPEINGVIAGGVFDRSDGEDAEFVFALGRVLDGVEVLIASRTAAEP